MLDIGSHSDGVPLERHLWVIFSLNMIPVANVGLVRSPEQTQLTENILVNEAELVVNFGDCAYSLSSVARLLHNRLRGRGTVGWLLLLITATVVAVSATATVVVSVAAIAVLVISVVAAVRHPRSSLFSLWVEKQVSGGDF